MKNPLPALAACTVLILFAAGCGKTEAPQPQAATSSPRVPDPLVPKMPDPKVPKGAEAASPLPGQANDDSSPAFKGGGAADPHK